MPSADHGFGGYYDSTKFRQFKYKICVGSHSYLLKMYMMAFGQGLLDCREEYLDHLTQGGHPLEDNNGNTLY